MDPDSILRFLRPGAVRRCGGAVLAATATMLMADMPSARSDPALALAPSSPGAATPVRIDRRLVVAVDLAWPWLSDQDATVPLPMLRAGYQLSPRLMIDAAVGSLGYEVSGRRTLVEFGARWSLRAGAISPFVGVRLGDYFDRADEGDDRSFPFASATAGMEYAGRMGVTAWAEIGPAMISYAEIGARSLSFGIYSSLGIGYRFGVR